MSIEQDPEWQALPLLDAAALESLAGDAGADVVGMLVTEFLDETERRVAEILRAVIDGDHQRLGFEGHALKSTCSTFGAARLGRRAALIEKSVKAGQNDHAVRLTDGIAAEREQTAAAFTTRFPEEPVD